MVGTITDLPDISEGYTAWKKDFDADKAGVFDIPVKKIVQYVEDIINQKPE